MFVGLQIFLGTVFAVTVTDIFTVLSKPDDRTEEKKLRDAIRYRR